MADQKTSDKQVPKRDEQGRLLPGECGNPKGRPPKGYSITEAFRSMLAAEPETKRKIVEAIKQKALQGDSAAQKLVWNYMDGMPVQGVELSGKDGEAIDTNLTVTFVTTKDAK